jgi:hypothetical protein
MMFVCDFVPLILRNLVWNWIYVFWVYFLSLFLFFIKFKKKTCLIFSVSRPCLWAWIFRLRDPTHLFNKAVFGEFGFYQKKNAFFFVLKACLPNITLRYFFSLWFLVNDVFGKYTLLFSRNIYFLIFCAFAKQTLYNFQKTLEKIQWPF